MTIERLRAQTLQDKNANIIVNRSRMTLFGTSILIFSLSFKACFRQCLPMECNNRLVVCLFKQIGYYARSDWSKTYALLCLCIIVFS